MHGFIVTAQPSVNTVDKAGSHGVGATPRRCRVDRRQLPFESRCGRGGARRGESPAPSLWRWAAFCHRLELQAKTRKIGRKGEKKKFAPHRHHATCRASRFQLLFSHMRPRCTRRSCLLPVCIIPLAPCPRSLKIGQRTPIGSDKHPISIRIYTSQPLATRAPHDEHGSGIAPRASGRCEVRGCS